MHLLIRAESFAERKWDYKPVYCSQSTFLIRRNLQNVKQNVTKTRMQTESWKLRGSVPSFPLVGEYEGGVTPEPLYLSTCLPLKNDPPPPLYIEKWSPLPLIATCQMKLPLVLRFTCKTKLENNRIVWSLRLYYLREGL